MRGAQQPESQGADSAARYFPQFEWTELDDVTPFLYAAKASRSERDAGLENFRPRSAAELTDSEEGQARLASPRTGAGRTGGARNPHPTIKPWTDLLRWLVRLVTPPRGVVLDQFAGTASCGLACVVEGFRYVGIELLDTDDEPHVSIARARLHYVEGCEFMPRESLRAPTAPKQASLFSIGEGAATDARAQGGE
jgi:site-specific DNA-methyltransferase (adenine-specific)